MPAEPFRALPNQVGFANRGGVDRDLVGPGAQELAHIFDRTHPAADRQRNEDLRSGSLDDVDHGVARIGRGGDVEKDELVRALIVVETSQLNRVAGVAEFEKLNTLDDAAVRHIEARNDAPGEPVAAHARASIVESSN